MIDLQTHRKALRISQSRLARLSGVSRFKISLFELGDGERSLEEKTSIQSALQSEADRLPNLPVVNFAPEPEIVGARGAQVVNIAR